MSDVTVLHPDQFSEPQTKVSPAERNQILVDLSGGEISLMEATERLGLPDAGWTLALLRNAGIWFVRLDDAEIRRQVDEGREALLQCLKPAARAMVEAR